MRTKLKFIITSLILIVVFCTSIENTSDIYSIIKATATVKKYTIIDTTILDSSNISTSEIPTIYQYLCWTDTSDSAQYLDSVSFPSDFLIMEFNSFRNTAYYLKRTYALRYQKDSILFMGKNYTSSSHCQSIDTSNRSMNNFLLYGNSKEFRQNNLFAKSKKGVLCWLFNAYDAYTLVSDRKTELANRNRIRDSIIASGVNVKVFSRQSIWSAGLNDTANYYYVDVRFSLEP